MVNSVQDSSVTGLMDRMNAKQGENSKSAVEETQERFMTLLVTQMRNQDPLNPLDNAQVTSQFAQLSTVTGIDKLNDTLASMMSDSRVSQSLQAANMIGHGVLVPGSELQLKEGGGLFGIELESPADKVDVTIRDANGKTVRTLNLGEREAGSAPVVWDGKTDEGVEVEEGPYTMTVSATRNDEKVSATTLQFGMVDTVSTGAGASGVKLNIDGLGAIDFADVRQIL